MQIVALIVLQARADFEKVVERVGRNDRLGQRLKVGLEQRGDARWRLCLVQLKHDATIVQVTQLSYGRLLAGNSESSRVGKDQVPVFVPE